VSISPNSCGTARTNRTIKAFTAMPLVFRAIIVFTSTFCANAQQVHSMADDLTFNFKCQRANSSKLDENFERFLKEKEFDVLNVPRSRRERGVMPQPLNFTMNAVNKERRMINIFSSGGSTPGWYSLHLLSPPPTHHAENLEEQILMFVSDTLGCSVHRVIRGENGSEASDFYAGFFNMMRNKIREGNGAI
jgi:hypothetical protein